MLAPPTGYCREIRKGSGRGQSLQELRAPAHRPSEPLLRPGQLSLTAVGGLQLFVPCIGLGAPLLHWLLSSGMFSNIFTCSASFYPGDLDALVMIAIMSLQSRAAHKPSQNLGIIDRLPTPFLLVRDTIKAFNLFKHDQHRQPPSLRIREQ